MGVEQTGSASTLRPLGERIGVHEAPHGATVEVHRQANRSDRFTGFMAAHRLFVTGRPAFRACSALALPSLERWFGRTDGGGLGGRLGQDGLKLQRLTRLPGCFLQLARAAQQQPLKGVAQVGQ
ncbi:hypothetical protein [Azohydromonas lata]|uniref:Uncharacterized protein n=1 Tax=Azohydromonas lata TaxID=45677 RepID=A0ABU5IPU0_9BURK|nr:hypothetical protein [Azohydromonas lata]MDZ5460915.1 hypothetical protein [Azohydromonas lata]